MRKTASIIVASILILGLYGCNETSSADPDINGEETAAEGIVDPITQEELYGE